MWEGQDRWLMPIDAASRTLKRFVARQLELLELDAECDPHLWNAGWPGAVVTNQFRNSISQWRIS